MHAHESATCLPIVLHGITEDFVTAYLQLHRIGIAHSIEVWDGSPFPAGLPQLWLTPNT